MPLKANIGTVDYIVLGLSIAIAAAIGIWFRRSGGEKSTAMEYLYAGKDMPMFPVILSTTVTLISAITMMIFPAEVYRYGIIHSIMGFGTIFGMILATFMFIPVYYNCGASSVYEFLEMRYGKLTRRFVSTVFLLQTILYMSSAIHGTVIALNAVSELSVEVSIFVFCGVCTFYCCLGGLKAVLWTDAFQAFLMFICVFTIYSTGVSDAGGMSTIYERALEGDRLNFFDFSMDFTIRYSFWSTFIRGIDRGIAGYGTNQVEVQRMLSLSSYKRAKSTLLISVVPVFILTFMCDAIGLLLYSIYYWCDPVLNTKATGVTKYDQLLPFYIVRRFHSVPGLTGLCLAGLFSGSLSTISSAINSLSTVTVVDFIKPLSPQSFSERRTVWIAKVLSLVYGLLCMGISFATVRMESLNQLVGTFVGVPEGVILAIFVTGVLTRKASDKCIIFCLLCGLTFTAWIGYGSLFGGHRFPTLPLRKDTCISTSGNVSSIQINPLTQCTDSPDCSEIFEEVYVSKDIFVMHKISFMWLTHLGFTFTICLIFITVLLTGWKDVIPPDSKCLSPVTRLWRKQSNIGSLNMNENNIVRNGTNVTEKCAIELQNYKTRSTEPVVTS